MSCRIFFRLSAPDPCAKRVCPAHRHLTRCGKRRAFFVSARRRICHASAVRRAARNRFSPSAAPPDMPCVRHIVPLRLFRPDRTRRRADYPAARITPPQYPRRRPGGSCLIFCRTGRITDIARRAAFSHSLARLRLFWPVRTRRRIPAASDPSRTMLCLFTFAARFFPASWIAARRVVPLRQLSRRADYPAASSLSPRAARSAASAADTLFRHYAVFCFSRPDIFRRSYTGVFSNMSGKDKRDAKGKTLK